MTEVGKRIAELRALTEIEHGGFSFGEVSQNELSALIGRSERYIGQVERGHVKTIGDDAQREICRVLGCSPAWLMFGVGARPRRRRVLRAVAVARETWKREAHKQ